MLSGVSSIISYSFPIKETFLPALFADANRKYSFTGRRRSSRTCRNFLPTMPVALTTATLYFFITIPPNMLKINLHTVI